MNVHQYYNKVLQQLNKDGYTHFPSDELVSKKYRQGVSVEDCAKAMRKDPDPAMKGFWILYVILGSILVGYCIVLYKLLNY